MAYHVPVMLQECLEGLEISPQGTYVDLTFGGGGHSKEILSRLDGGHLIAFDQDIEAKQQAAFLDLNGKRFDFVQSNFMHLKRQLQFLGIKKVDGILADLGISSHQIDTAERGFSTRFSGELDMRMDVGSEKTAASVLNTYSMEELHRIFGMYGEIKNAKTLAQKIVNTRGELSISHTNDLVDLVSPFAPKNRLYKYLAQVFQALRIEVNDELKALEDMLLQCAEVIKPGGNLVIMSYHSLEDRLVKNFFAKGKFKGDAEKDFYGNLIRPFEPTTRKPIVSHSQEIEANPRARSAKLRIAKRNQESDKGTNEKKGKKYRKE